jgi:hypothetical protein
LRSFLVYLAGPISGLSYGASVDWRDYVADHLAMVSDGQIRSLSPMRNKQYLKEEKAIGDSYEGTVMSSQRGITARDRYDCTRANLVLVNLLGAQRVSIGTVMEIAWADLNRIPIVLVMEKEGNLHDHAMLREACPFRVTTLEEAVDVVNSILLP